MAIAIQYAGKVLEIKFSGEISQRDFEVAFLQVAKLEEAAERAPDRIIYIDAASGLNWNFGMIDDVARRRKAMKLKNAIKSAVVAEKDVQYGLARMFQALITNPQMKLAVFRDAPTALAWLESEP